MPEIEYAGLKYRMDSAAIEGQDKRRWILVSQNEKTRSIFTLLSSRWREEPDLFTDIRRLMITEGCNEQQAIECSKRAVDRTIYRLV